MSPAHDIWERQRKRFQGRAAYFRRVGRQTDAQQAEEALRHMSPGGVMPEHAGPLMAHCGQWWPVEALPWVAPCCGWRLPPPDRHGEGE